MADVGIHIIYKNYVRLCIYNYIFGMIWIYLAPYDGLLVPNEGMTPY